MTEKVHGAVGRRSDWLFLPAIALVTVLGLMGLSEVAARVVYPEQRAILASCFVLNDPVHGVRGKPGCAFEEAGSESGFVHYQFDDWGYRNPQGLLSNSSGAYRIVLTGSSVALAEHVSQPQSAAAGLPQLLQRQTGRRTVLYNEGMGFGFVHNTDLRFQDVLNASPNMILWIITPYDVLGASMVNPTTNLLSVGKQSLLFKIRSSIRKYFENEKFSQAVSDFLSRTRTAYTFRHFVYQSPSLYLKSYLTQVDSEQGFLRKNLSPEWLGHIQEVQRYSADISRKAHAAHIPLVVVYVPNHAQAEMVATGQIPPGYDPCQLDETLRSMMTAQGDIYLDILPAYRNLPVTEIQQDYLPVDGHPNAGGQALIARLIAEQLTSGVIPELRAKARTGAGK